MGRMESAESAIQNLHKMSRAFSADRFCFRKSWGGAPGSDVNARLWRSTSSAFSINRGIKRALQNERFPAEAKQWNADRNSGNRDRDWIATGKDHDRSSTRTV